MIGRHDNRNSLRLRATPTSKPTEHRRNISPSIAVAIVAHVALAAGLAAWKLPPLLRSTPVSATPVSTTISFAGLRETPSVVERDGGNRNTGGRENDAALARLESLRPTTEFKPPPLPLPEPSQKMWPVIGVEAAGEFSFTRYQPMTTPSPVFSGAITGAGAGEGSGSGVTGAGAGTGSGNGAGDGFGGANYLRSPQPRYPAVAREQGWEGTTLLRVEIQADGLVGAIQIVQSAGHRELDDAAIESVRAAQFQAARLNGTPVASWVEVPVKFRLNRE